MKTVSDLIERFQLYAVCTDCQRMERVDIRSLVGRFGADLTIDACRRRLRCRHCRRRTGDIRIVYVGENGRLSGFHYRGHSTRRSAVQSVSSSVDSSVNPKPSTPT